MVYGSRRWRLPLSLQLAATQVGMGGAGLAALIGFPPGTLPLLLLTKALNAPAAISASVLLNYVAPKGTLAQSYTLVVTVGLVGSAGREYGCGALTTMTGEGSLFLMAASGMTAVAL